MAKKYTLALDVSPSEQVSDNLQDIKTMGVVLGLNSPTSFQEVGSEFAEPSQRLNLRKWAGTSNSYKRNFISHMANVVASRRVICGYGHSNVANLLGIGGIVYQKYFGKFPEPSSLNKKGKPRIKLGGYVQDGVMVPPYEVLVFDLCTIGWIASEVLSLLQMADRVTGENCKFDVIADRLPNEQGGDRYFLSTILRTLLHRASDSRVDLVGVPDPARVVQRDLFVDNVAGLANLLLKDPYSEISLLSLNCPTKLFGITRGADERFFTEFESWHKSKSL